MTNKTTKRALFSSVLALFLCFTMLIGTTYAWFTDEVTSAGNIIQTGTLKVGFQHVAGTEDPDTTNAWETVNGALFDYANWEPGYAVAKHLKVTNEGTLALNYKLRIVADGVVSKLADVIDVYVVTGASEAISRDTLKNAVEFDATATPADGTVIRIGTLAEVMGTEKNIGKTINGSIEVGGDADVYTLVLKMQEEADNKYQNMDLGCTFSVQLLAAQMSAESDSFDNKYDEIAPNEEIPAALVRPLEDLSVDVGIHSDYGDLEGMLLLDTGYNFHPTLGRPEDPSFGEPGAGHLEYDPEFSVDDSKYKYWHADFVVKADKDVPADSMALAGYYSIFCDGFNDGKWIALSHDDVITAGTEIRLVDAMADGAITVCWEDLCAYGNDGIGFACGAVDLTGENAGTTLTVELYLYETGCDVPGCHHSGRDCEIRDGEKIKVGEFKYTFGLKPWDGTYDANQLPTEENGVITIETAAQLAAFANDVNVNRNTYSGKTVVLAEDIDLGNKAWTPIGQTGATQFQGTFDGQGHTIYNLKVDSLAQTGANYSSGLFGWLNRAVVKNVNVDGATISGNHNVAVIAGYLETSGCTISNCNVANATIVAKHANGDACGDKVGVIVGHAGNAGVVVENCSAEDSTIVAGRDAGQIAGAAKTANVIGCTASNVTVTAGGDCTGANVNEAIIGRVL